MAIQQWIDEEMPRGRNATTAYRLTSYWSRDSGASLGTSHRDLPSPIEWEMTSGSVNFDCSKFKIRSLENEATALFSNKMYFFEK